MNGIAAMKENVDRIHRYLEAAIQGTDPTTLGRKLEGATIDTIGEIYGHAIHSEDWAVQRILKAQDLLLRSGGWGERLGVDASARQPDWLSSAQKDLSALGAYAQAVYASTDAYLSSIDDVALDSEVDYFGRAQPIGSVLAEMVIAHIAFHAGEIASLKGVMGQKGLPW